MTTVAYASVSGDGLTFRSQLLLCGSDDADARAGLVTASDVDLRRLIDGVHENGAAISFQLTHAGGFADHRVTGRRQLGPSRVFNPAGFDWCREMTAADMQRVLTRFVDAATRLQRLGVDAVEIHCGHGCVCAACVQRRDVR
jgi:2,4-dienoyl-CoA reductase-like NADH-dependent reductase (Old Yellow Enzyme family)